MRISQAINHFGTLANIANALSVSPSTVAEWKKRGRIPEKYHLSLENLVKDDSTKPKSRMPFEEAMRYFGSIQSMAKVVGVNPKTVYLWRDKGVVPARSSEKIRGLIPRARSSKEERG